MLNLTVAGPGMVWGGGVKPMAQEEVEHLRKEQFHFKFPSEDGQSVYLRFGDASAKVVGLDGEVSGTNEVRAISENGLVYIASLRKHADEFSPAMLEGGKIVSFSQRQTEFRKFLLLSGIIKNLGSFGGAEFMGGGAKSWRKLSTLSTASDEASKEMRKLFHAFSFTWSESSASLIADCLDYIQECRNVTTARMKDFRFIL
jgi:hypothetical protein